MLAIRRFKGINLIELLVALVIVSILTLVAVPTFSTLISNYRLSSSADNLYYYLQYARSEAIKRNASVYVSFNTGDTWCYGVKVGSACNCTVANDCTLATSRYGSSQQISLTTTGLTGNSIFFEGSHGAANASGSVTFTKYNQSSPLVRVTIGRLGGLQMCSTDVGGYTAC